MSNHDDPNAPSATTTLATGHVATAENEGVKSVVSPTIIWSLIALLLIVGLVTWGLAIFSKPGSIQSPKIVTTTRTIAFGENWGKPEIFPPNVMITIGGSTGPFRIKNAGGVEVGSELSEIKKLASTPEANLVLQFKAEPGSPSGSVMISYK